MFMHRFSPLFLISSHRLCIFPCFSLLFRIPLIVLTHVMRIRPLLLFLCILVWHICYAIVSSCILIELRNHFSSCCSTIYYKDCTSNSSSTRAFLTLSRLVILFSFLFEDNHAYILLF